MSETFLQGEGGAFSMRRLLALMFAITSILCGVGSIYGYYKNLSATTDNSWLIVLVSFLAPGCISLILMFFTTWSDIAKTVKAIKKGE